MPVRIALVDRYSMIREGVKRMIDAEPDFRVVGTADCENEALTLIAELEPDVVIIEPSEDIARAHLFVDEIRGHSVRPHIILLTKREDPRYASELLRAGVNGYVLKRSSPRELVQAIRQVMANMTYVDQKIVASLLPRVGKRRIELAAGERTLSEREMQVLKLSAQGYTNKEVATILAISIKSVETYKARSMQKLHLYDRVALVALAARNGWLGSIPAAPTSAVPDRH